MTYDMLEKVLNNLDDYICKLVYSQSEKKILGFCLCLIVAPSDIESIVKLSDNQIPSALKHSDKIGIIKTVAVDKIGCIKGSLLFLTHMESLLDINIYQ